MAKFANDNHDSISGRAAHAWPAMTRLVSDGELDLGVMLSRFARLYELANTPAEAVASPSGRYEELATSAIADELDDTAGENGEPCDIGLQVDFCVEYGKTPDQLYELSKDGAYTNLLANGKRGAEHNPNFRIRHIFYNAEVDGKRTRTFHSWAEYKGNNGNWYRLDETLKRPRGPSRKGDDWKKWASTVHPSKRKGATRHEYAAEERLDARQVLEWLRREIDADAFEVLRMAAAERSTARRIGETRGQTHKRASALGAKLIREALTAANVNLKLVEAA